MSNNNNSNNKNNDKKNEPSSQDDPFSNWKISTVRHNNNYYIGDSNIVYNNENINNLSEDFRKKIRYRLIVISDSISDLKQNLGLENLELIKQLDEILIELITSGFQIKEIIGVLHNLFSFINEAVNPDSVTGSIIKNINEGKSIIKDITDHYNMIAKYFGLPPINSNNND